MCVCVRESLSVRVVVVGYENHFSKCTFYVWAERETSSLIVKRSANEERAGALVWGMGKRMRNENGKAWTAGRARCVGEWGRSTALLLRCRRTITLI